MTNSKNPPKRSIIYIDALNLFYGAVRNTPYLWLDIQKLFERLRQQDLVEKIYYFTAKVKWPKESRKRQQEYLRALGTLSKVTLVYGYFANRPITRVLKADSMKIIFKIPNSEEKRTDVNIATQMIDDAHGGMMDIAILVSGDSDLVPPIELIRRRFPAIKVVVYIPAKDANSRRAKKSWFEKCAHAVNLLPQNLIERSQFPDKILDALGSVVAERPASWR